MAGSGYYGRGRNSKRPTMTAQEAASFRRYSATNAAIVASALPCGCEPYRDVFTYNRWLGLGMQVQRGERAVQLAILKEVDEIDEDGPTGATVRVRARAAVFCRHQVAPDGAFSRQTWPRGLSGSGISSSQADQPKSAMRAALRQKQEEWRREHPETRNLAVTVDGAPTKAAPANDNAAVDGIMAGFEVLS